MVVTSTYSGDIAVCGAFSVDCTVCTSSWLAAAPSLNGCWALGAVAFVVLCLDEDCNPGWGDSGRPLRCGLC